MYDFLFRQQSSSQGRWLAPDPAGLAAVDITNPQTWNRYAYVMNDPVDNYDPLGLSCSIYLNNSLNLLSPGQLSAMQSSLESVLAPANADVTVGMTLTNADNIFSITISQNPTAINSHLNPNSTVGYTAPTDGGVSNSSWVFADVLSKVGASYAPFGQNSLGLGIGAGRAGSHEFLHFVLQVGNSGHVPGTPFQAGFSASQWFGTNPTPSVWTLSKSQVSAIQSTCGKKPSPSPGKGPGGGGGGGTGGWGGDGQWVFWQPVYWGSEGISFGTGQWIQWGSSGIFRMSVY